MTRPPAEIDSICRQARQIADPAERSAFIERACGGDAALREQVDSALAADPTAALPPSGASDADETHALPGGTPDSGPAPAGAEHATIEEGPGSVIDRYKLVEQIGEGGFGVVYRANQEKPVRRQVALKVIKLGMDTRQVVSRFEAERQALAMMDHPHIAKVLDAGSTSTGRPYFVMELVDGVPITDYCDRHKVSFAERLRLFVAVCEAVQHAHQKGIIHRDIKPSNILVTHVDGRAVPKVIDFGIAKATEQRLNEDTMFTQLGQFIGTPAYMSPEQADPSTLDIDTRSDIYSLGVVLYELLTGATPFDTQTLRRAGLEEIKRVIREQEPSKPSTRLATLGNELTTIATLRGIEPRKLTSTLRGDLDWIIMRALEKDRGRRYETASDFARDIERYLRKEPVSAGPPSAIYRLGKFVRRHRAGVAVSAVAAMILPVFAAVMTVQARRVAVERDRSERVVEFQEEMLRSVEPRDMGRALIADLRERVEESARERNVTDQQLEATLKSFDILTFDIDTTDVARGIFDENILAPAIESIGEELADEPETRARLLQAVGRSYRSIGLHAKALEQFEEVEGIRQQALGPHHRDTLWIRTYIADTLQRVGRAAEGEQVYDESLALWEKHWGADDPRALDAAFGLGVLYLNTERYEEARALFERILPEQERVLGEDHTDIGGTLSNLATVLMNMELYDEVEPIIQRTLQIYEDKYGLDNRNTQYARMRLARLLSKQQRGDEAIAMMEEIIAYNQENLGGSHPSTLTAIDELGVVYSQQNEIQKSLEQHQRAFDLRREALGDSNPSTLTSMTSLAIRYSQAGDQQSSERLMRESLRLTEELLGPDHPETLQCVGNLGVTLWFQGRLDEAAPLFDQVYQWARKTYGDHHQETAFRANNLSILYVRLGRFDEAEALLDEVQAFRSAEYGEEDHRTLETVATLGYLAGERERWDEALEIYLDLFDKRKRVLGEKNLLTLESGFNLGVAYNHLDRSEDALPVFENNVALRREALGNEHSQTLDSITELAALYIDLGREDEARPLTEEVIATRVAQAEQPDATPAALNEAARLLVVCDFEDLRDAGKAVEFARRANEQSGNADALFLNTLAQAYHAAGQHDAAVETQRKAIAQLGPQAGEREEYRERLAEYESAM
jgi:hypothetical protein